MTLCSNYFKQPQIMIVVYIMYLYIGQDFLSLFQVLLGEVLVACVVTLKSLLYFLSVSRSPTVNREVAGSFCHQCKTMSNSANFECMRFFTTMMIGMNSKNSASMLVYL